MKVSSSISVYETMDEAGWDTTHCSFIPIAAPIRKTDHETVSRQTYSGTDMQNGQRHRWKRRAEPHLFSLISSLSLQRWYASLLNLCGF